MSQRRIFNQLYESILPRNVKYISNNQDFINNMLEYTEHIWHISPSLIYKEHVHLYYSVLMYAIKVDYEDLNVKSDRYGFVVH